MLSPHFPKILSEKADDTTYKIEAENRIQKLPLPFQQEQ